MTSGDMVEEMARAICTLNSGGYCDCVGESLGCKVGRGEPPERSRCKMTAEALPLSAEYQMAQAAATIAKGRMDELYTAAANLRQAQRDYMEIRNGPHDERETFGRAVAEAADNLDDVLAALKDSPNVG